LPKTIIDTLPIKNTPEIIANAQRWPEKNIAPALTPGHIHVWRIRLGTPLSNSVATHVLSPDELDRARRFRFERDRVCFIQSRSALRCLLGHYLATSAMRIRFEYLHNGKPALQTKLNSLGLRFNVAHSASWALIAICTDREVGIDIEEIRRDLDTGSLAERFFSPRERANLRELSDDLQLVAFFACWTRKEALLKATGTGLSSPLEGFSVSTNPALDPILEETGGSSGFQGQWSLADLNVEQGYRATLAVEGICPEIKTYSYMPTAPYSCP
jgi:4'-phosphopantetheinyl transferase